MWEKLKKLLIKFLPTYKHRTINYQNITIDEYITKSDKAVIFYPILSGDNVVARLMANYVAIVHRMSAFIVHRPIYPYEANTPEKFNEIMRYAMERGEEIQNFIESKRYINKDRVVAIGTSMGAIINAGTVNTTNFKKYICIAGGAPVLDVMHNSSLEVFKKWFDEQIDKHDSMENTYDVVEQYKDEVKHDPIIVADNFFNENKKVIFINCMFDQIVPSRFQMQLNESFGKFGIWLPCGHITLTLFAPIVLAIISYQLIKV